LLIGEENETVRPDEYVMTRYEGEVAAGPGGSPCHVMYKRLPVQRLSVREGRPVDV